MVKFIHIVEEVDSPQRFVFDELLHQNLSLLDRFLASSEIRKTKFNCNLEITATAQRD